jgi:hypothetical protein
LAKRMSEALTLAHATNTVVIPANAGNQYPAAFVLNINSTEYWVARSSRAMTSGAHVPLGFTRRVGIAFAGSSGQGCRG